jgi:hypothetical protein
VGCGLDIVEIAALVSGNNVKRIEGEDNEEQTYEVVDAILGCLWKAILIMDGLTPSGKGREAKENPWISERVCTFE